MPSAIDLKSAARQIFTQTLSAIDIKETLRRKLSRSGSRIQCCGLEIDLASYQGRELYGATAPDANGLRRVLRHLTKGTLDELRPLAQSFTARPKAVFVAALSQPPSVLLAVSADAAVDAGKTLKAALETAGGRGGGSPRMAQGSVAGAHLLERVLDKLG